MEPLISKEQFAIERRLLWPRVWLMVGRLEEIPEVGDYLIKEIPANNVSLIVVRGRDGVVRALHNVCPHRGSLVCWESDGAKGSTSAFKCPYHAFTFDLEGALQWVPDQENFYNMDRSKHGLTQVVTDFWAGFIFVHLSPSPDETLKEYLGEVGEKLADYPFHEQSHFYQYRAVLKCSWKVAMANFQETFHHVLHVAASPGVISNDNPFSHNPLVKLMGKHRLISVYRNPKMTRTKLGAIAATRHANSRLKAEPPSGEEPLNINKTFTIHNIFPNFQLNVNNGVWFRHQFWPLTADTVLWETRKYFPKPRNASERFFHEHNIVNTRDIFAEDGACIEFQQKGLRSGISKRWILQDEEIAIQHFNKIISDYTGSAR